MTYSETVEYLYNCVPMFQNVGASGYKEGLANTYAFDNHLGHPHTAYPTIHVAGTNGKGSCSHTIAAILQSAGYKVGLYTSPHLVDFRERIRVNGRPISEEYVTQFVDKERSFFEPLSPSFFEVTTALAFKYFEEEKVDVAVIEVGLGGRLDCTNIITPVLSIITNISFDHMQFLGNTLDSIAHEKAGIIKCGVPVVVGETVPATRAVFANRAKEVGADILFAQEQKEVISSQGDNNKGGREYQTRTYGMLYGELGGLCQEKNTNTVLCALSYLRKKGFSLKEENIRGGFAHVCELTGLMGRWQKIGDCPQVYCDTAHNEGGFSYISSQLKAQKCKQLRIVFGMVDDKDISSVLEMMPTDARYYFTHASVRRSMNESDMLAMGQAHGLMGQAYPTVASAYEAALGDSEVDDFIYVGGSSYVVADLLKYLGK